MPRARPLAVLLLGLVAIAGCGGSSAPPAPAKLLFVSSRDGDYAIFGISAGGDEHRLTKAKGDPSSPSGLFFQIEPDWSPDGRLIAFASRRDGRSHIDVMRADGTGTRRLTDSPADDDSPAWAPDGRRIAFARNGDLFTVAASGGPARRLSRGLGGEAAHPAWSPNGRLIAYDYRRPGYSIREIWVARADGRHARPVTSLRAVSTLPAWSPDGRRLAFQSDAHDRHVEIYSIGLDSSGLRRETRSSIDTIEPAWSPSGKEIAFSRDGAIWTVDRAGRERKVTSGENDSAPVWRPRAA
jgi:Tol biopolymer transport system component